MQFDLIHKRYGLKQIADPIFYSNRAACYANLVQFDKVLEGCNEAILLNPNYTKALYRRVQAFERKGDFYNVLFGNHTYKDHILLCGQCLIYPLL